MPLHWTSESTGGTGGTGGAGMETRVLGRTGLRVGVLGMGGLFLAERLGEGRDEARRAVQRALELGVNFFDSAPSYGNSEEVLGYALAGASAPFFLSTKLGGRPDPFDARDAAALR